MGWSASPPGSPRWRWQRPHLPTCRQLIALYTAIQGGNWTNSSDWLGPAGSECNWQASAVRAAASIPCCWRTMDSAALPPASFRRRQRPSSCIWAQTGQSNPLLGPIPVTLDNLGLLEVLWLHNTQLTGDIPSQLGALQNLRFLDLSGNQLRGSILANLGSLAQFRHLYPQLLRTTSAQCAGCYGRRGRSRIGFRAGDT